LQTLTSFHVHGLIDLAVWQRYILFDLSSFWIEDMLVQPIAYGHASYGSNLTSTKRIKQNLLAGWSWQITKGEKKRWIMIESDRPVING